MVGNFMATSANNKNVWHSLAQRLAESNWQVLTTSTQVKQWLRLIDMLATILFKRKQYSISQVDVFSGRAFTFAYLCTRFLRYLRKPVVITLHGGNLPEFAKNHPSFVKKLLMSANITVSPSNYLKKALNKFASRIMVIPNPIEIKHFPFLLRDIPHPSLVWVRAFHEIYNPILAVRVLSVLVDFCPDIRLIMVGPDKGDGSFQRTIEEAKNLGVQERIQFTGGVDRSSVPNWLFKGDIFINTTNFDNMPSSVIEAMACGLPVVSTNVGGLPYLIDDGVDGVLVPPNNVQAMAAAVQRVLVEPDLAEKLSSNARKKAESFDWSIILPKWEELLSSIIETHTR